VYATLHETQSGITCGRHTVDSAISSFVQMMEVQAV